MLFIVPDDSSPKDVAPESTKAGTSLDAPLDVDDADSGPSTAQAKVELDLDDAPFLTEEEPEPEPQPAPTPEADAAAPATAEEAPPKKRFDIKALLKNKRFLIGAGGGLFLILAAVVYLLVFSGPEAPPPPPPPAENATQGPKEPPKPTEYYIRWEPFWVEFKDAEGNTRFLVCRFAGVTTNEALKAEAENKEVVLRDQIYYYLMHKDKAFLGNAANASALKNDIMAVVNQQLSGGQLDQVLLEDYVIK